jgi:hypothetical protein
MVLSKEVKQKIDRRMEERIDAKLYGTKREDYWSRRKEVFNNMKKHLMNRKMYYDALGEDMKVLKLEHAEEYVDFMQSCYPLSIVLKHCQKKVEVIPSLWVKN